MNFLENNLKSKYNLKKMNHTSTNIIYLILSIFMITLIGLFSVIAINLLPFKHWANYQNECIKQESIDKTISWAVRKCNGRSKVYQVK